MGGTLEATAEELSRIRRELVVEDIACFEVVHTRPNRQQAGTEFSSLMPVRSPILVEHFWLSLVSCSSRTCTDGWRLRGVRSRKRRGTLTLLA